MKKIAGQIFEKILGEGRILFAFAFMTPLFAQLMVRFDLTPPLGLSPLLTGALVAGVLGMIARTRGRWI